MREVVLVMPPTTERSQAGFCLGKTDEAIFNTSRKCTASEVIYVKRSSDVAGIRRDLKAEEEVNTLEFVSAEKMETEALRGEDYSTAPPLGPEKHERIDGEVYSKQMVRSLVSLSLHQTQQNPLQGAPPLQWGSLKRSRCSRGPNNQPKTCDSVDESKAVQVQAVKDPLVILNSSAVASEENPDSKNAIARKRDHPFPPSAIAAEHADLEEDCKREKRLRSSDSMEGKRGVSVQAGKRGSLQASQQACHQREYLPITRSSLGKRAASPDKHPAALTDGLKASRAGKPKFVLSLSRKEIEEDFLMFKGSKLTKRPRRRIRVAENAVLYCTPGIWLSDVSYARYNVKEKKCVKEKPRGLKAMQSLDSDSE